LLSLLRGLHRFTLLATFSTVTAEKLVPNVTERYRLMTAKLRPGMAVARNVTSCTRASTNVAPRLSHLQSVRITKPGLFHEIFPQHL
jgi:hypothetical protein